MRKILIPTLQDKSIRMDFVSVPELYESEYELSWFFNELCLRRVGYEGTDIGDVFNGSLVGSSSELSDEGFSFSSDGFQMLEITLFVPEVNFDGRQALSAWLNSNAQMGFLRMEIPSIFHAISPSDRRFLSEDCKYLLSVKDNIRVDDSCWRCKLHSSLDLLCQNDDYVGLILNNPINWLTDFLGDSNDFAGTDEFMTPPELVFTFHEFFELVEECNWELFEAADSEAMRKLLAIKDSLLKLQCRARPVVALLNRCSTILEDYYDV